jgi:hypothetical protein
VIGEDLSESQCGKYDVPTTAATLSVRTPPNCTWATRGNRDPYEPVRVLPNRREWKITDGPEEGSVTIATPAPGGNEPLTLGLSPLLIFPPLVALSRADPRDRGWTLQPT